METLLYTNPVKVCLTLIELLILGSAENKHPDILDFA